MVATFRVVLNISGNFKNEEELEDRLMDETVYPEKTDMVKVQEVEQTS